MIIGKNIKKMRILIFGHTAFYNTKLSIEETSKGGGWMDTLILELQNHKEIHLGLADGCATIDYKGKMLRKDCKPRRKSVPCAECTRRKSCRLHTGGRSS